MDLLNSPWLIALFTFFIGIAAGIVIHRSKYSDSNQADKLKDELESLEDEFRQYKASVSEHFDKTSELVKGLTENYVKVYQHLAEGSQTLSDTDQTALKLGQNEQYLASAINWLGHVGTISEADTDMEPPKDYAPKPTDSESEGTLSEAFSIKKDKHKQASEELLESDLTENDHLTARR